MDGIEPITPKTQKYATEALLRAALFDRLIVRELAESHPGVMLEAMGTDADGPRWKGVELADATIDE